MAGLRAAPQRSRKQSTLLPPQSPKLLGAYYTPEEVATFLVGWAVRSARDVVLDPSFGAGVFLRAAAGRLRALGGDPEKGITGVELDPAVHLTAVSELVLSENLNPERLYCEDFFRLTPSEVGYFHAVVGNPPFIRYQRFAGTARELALRRALEVGVQLSQLTSAWAPFLVHAIRFLRPGGRLAVVVPAELGHAAYARPVLRYFTERFRRLTLVTFSRRLFKELHEETALLLGEDAGSACESFSLLPLADASELFGQDRDPLASTGRVKVTLDRLTTGRMHLVAYYLPRRTLDLYEAIASRPEVIRLGAWGRVGIGYVTGHNSYFHLTRAEANEVLPPGERRVGLWWRQAIRRAGWLQGPCATRQDWWERDRRGEKSRLLMIRAGGRLPRGLRDYVARGEAQGVHLAYKCRVRTPWYSVPHVKVGHALLTYMAHEAALLVRNQARAVVPNTLLTVSRRPGVCTPVDALAACWYTSLTCLSAELKGHSLGGGMLKLEPGEAVMVRLAMPASLSDPGSASTFLRELDRVFRTKGHRAALDFGDKVVLREHLGLSARDCQELYAGYQTLLTRRRERSRHPLVGDTP